jgi:peptidoglycan hydrolase CwlO-like protein
MHFNREFRFRILCLAFFLFIAAMPGLAGVSHAIQEQYKRDYENKAMFLKIPIYTERQVVYISGQSIRVEPGSGSPRFKVGDQVRILTVDFSGDEIKFKMSGITTSGAIEIGFRFDTDLQEDFPNRAVFDRALQDTFTEGLKYTEIDDAKRSYVEKQFEQSVRAISDSASLSRESVLKNIAPQVPAYQDARRENETLRNRVQDISTQLSQSQSENQKLESESKRQLAEVSRLKNANAALQEKIDNSASQITRLGSELRDVKGNAQDYQREITNLQRSLNIKVDAARDLTAQIADLGQAMKKVQQDNEGLTSQIVSLRANLDAQQAANARLVGENEELKADNRKMQSTINTLTSNKNSLATQYLNLKREKEKLDDFSKSIAALRTRIEEEKSEDGFYLGKANIYAKNVLLGSLSWRVPTHLNHDESRNGEATFSAESIDYVRINPEERLLLRSLGSPLKVRIDLASESTTMSVTPEAGERFHEIGERDHSNWRWSIKNKGTQDARFVITAGLLDKNSNEIPIFQQEDKVAASNPVRQIRGYLQPVPLIVGVVLGFLLFGIVGIFRRTPKAKKGPKQPPSADSEPPPHMTQKQL